MWAIVIFQITASEFLLYQQNTNYSFSISVNLKASLSDIVFSGPIIPINVFYHDLSYKTDHPTIFTDNFYGSWKPCCTILYILFLGKDESRARDLFYALWIPDLFMERVESDGIWSLFCPNEALGLSEVWGDEFNELYKK